MISASYCPAQNFSVTCSGSISLASWQFAFVSLSPIFSSADAGWENIAMLAAVSATSPQFVRRIVFLSFFENIWPCSQSIISDQARMFSVDLGVLYTGLHLLSYNPPG